MKLGDTFNETFIVNEIVYAGFIEIFRDKNILHANEKHAQAYGFEGKVMHGNILNGFLSYFVGECLPLKNVIIHTQEIQFKNPVYLNNQLNFEAKITGLYESVNAVEFKYTFKNEKLNIVAKGKLQIGLL